MTDPTVVEGNPITPPEQGSATTPASTPGTGQPSQDLSALWKKFEELEKQYRGLQKGEHKELDRLKKELSPAIEFAQRLGIDPEKIREEQRKLYLDRLIEQGESEPVAPEPVSGTSHTGNAEEVKAMIKKAGLDESDPDVLAEITSGKVGVDLALSFGALKQRKTAAPSPTQAQSPAPVVPPASQPDTDGLVKKLRELQVNPSVNWQQIEEIEKQLGW